MGKKQHQKDKLYLTCTEWTNIYGGKKPEQYKSEFKRLPFHSCSLSLQPFEHPYCTPEGNIFDLENIVPFLKKFGRNPVTGEKLDPKDLIKLNLRKNTDGEYHCPVTFKVFTDNSNIIALRTTGNVFSQEAIETLNFKTKHFRDLLTDEPFTKKDLIVLQDPTNLDKFNLDNFKFLKEQWKIREDVDRSDPRFTLKAINSEARTILDELDKSYKAPEKKEEVVKSADKVNAALYSQGKVSASFTSTSMDVVTTQQPAILDEDEVRYERILKMRKKGYVRLVTNMGPLNIELFCDQVPLTCENFLKHCLNKYYNGTKFHRSIKNFIVQGGDPTGTGTGGQSIWNKPFNDEFRPHLTHTGRGVVSMANHGPDSNKSQFFITYRSCRHLDNKHTIFGRIVGGVDTLSKMEAVPTDRKTDIPQEEMIITDCMVFVDPYEEVDVQIKKERDEELESTKKKPPPPKPAASQPKQFRQGVGKYISNAAFNEAKRSAPLFPDADEDEQKQQPEKKKLKANNQFGDFGSW